MTLDRNEYQLTADAARLPLTLATASVDGISIGDAFAAVLVESIEDIERRMGADAGTVRPIGTLLPACWWD